jgi:hypothetical protein
MFFIRKAISVFSKDQTWFRRYFPRVYMTPRKMWTFPCTQKFGIWLCSGSFYTFRTQILHWTRCKSYFYIVYFITQKRMSWLALKIRSFVWGRPLACSKLAVQNFLLCFEQGMILSVFKTSISQSFKKGISFNANVYFCVFI